MRGHLMERRPGVWRLVVSNGFDPSGKRRQVVRTVKGKRRDAERELTRLLRDLDDGRLADGRQTLARFLSEEWLPEVSAMSKRGQALAPTTRQRYSDSVRHVSSVIGSVRLTDLRAKHVEKLRDALITDALAAETVSGIMRVLSQALNRAESREYIGRNYASPELATRPAGAEGTFIKIDAALAGRILTAANGADPWDAAVHLGLGLGLRREEVLALTWADVNDSVHVRRALTAANGELHIGAPKTRASERTIPLPAFVARALQRHRQAQADRLGLIGVGTMLVVDNGIGGPWQPATFSGAWRKFARANGIEGITFHTLRHGAATLMLASGVPDAVAISVMGHADTKILRRYQDVVDELQRDAATRMDRLLGGERV